MLLASRLGDLRTVVLSAITSATRIIAKEIGTSWVVVGQLDTLLREYLFGGLGGHKPESLMTVRHEGSVLVPLHSLYRLSSDAIFR
jgi:hypothetical protein